MQTILVTGGAGYVGSQLVPLLLAQGYQVRVLDWLIFDEHVFDHLLPNSPLEIQRGDIRNQETVVRSLEGVDAVIHLAAISNDPSSELDPLLTREINLDAVKYLVDAAKKQGVQRFINASSASVYGIKEEDNVTEELSLEPLTLYAQYKAESETYVTAANTRDFTTVSVRPATLCGYAPRLRLDLTVNILTHHAIRKGKITVFGGEQKRPNLFIQDMIDLYLLLLRVEKAKIASQVFNVGAANYSVIEIAHIVKSVLNSSVGIEIVSTMDQRSYHISSEKIRQVLGFTPRYSIAEAVRDLQQAFAAGRVPDADNPRYYNVRLMRELDVVRLGEARFDEHSVR